MAYTNKTTRTKVKIQRTLLELMEKKRFDNITVSDITDLAEINRSTFYRHYVDKYELLEVIEENILNDFREHHAKMLENVKKSTPLLKDFKFEDYINRNTHFLNLFEKRLPEFKILLSSNGDPEFNDKMYNFLFNLFKISIEQVIPKSEKININLCLAYQVSSFLGTVKYWTKNPSLTADEIFEFLFAVQTKGWVTLVRENI